MRICAIFVALAARFERMHVSTDAEQRRVRALLCERGDANGKLAAKERNKAMDEESCWSKF